MKWVLFWLNKQLALKSSGHQYTLHFFYTFKLSCLVYWFGIIKKKKIKTFNCTLCWLMMSLGVWSQCIIPHYNPILQDSSMLINGRPLNSEKKDFFFSFFLFFQNVQMCNIHSANNVSPACHWTLQKWKKSLLYVFYWGRSENGHSMGPLILCCHGLQLAVVVLTASGVS